MIDDENKNQQGITAYHGSPHEFDQFDTSKIGTGEGAQSYGHGLYFAESEPTAKYYKDTLAHRGQIDLEHEANQREMPMSREAMIEVRRHANGSVDPLEAAKHMHWSSIEARQYPQEKLADLIDLYRKAKQGHMYEVAIDAHPDHMLDWDKPLSEQSFHIGKSIFDARKDNPTLFNVFKPHLEKDSTGMGFYQSLATQHPNGYQGATDFLQRAGIKGIKYQDAGSRGAGQYDLHVMYKGKPHSDPIPMMDKAQAEHHAKEYQAKGYDTEVKPRGTHNYVVFDHNRVKVKRRYKKGGRIDAYNDGGYIPVGDPRREENLADWHAESHPLTKNPDGTPKKYFTGTSKDVAFENKKAGFKTDRHGAWFTTDPKVASMYAEENDSQGYKMDGWSVKPTNTASRVLPTHIKALNPHTGERPEYTGNNYKKFQSDWFDTLRSKGHDAWIPESGNGNLAVALGHPTQIKSATGNNGHFDPSNPEITKAEGGYIERTKRSTGGRIPEADKLFKAAKKDLDGHTKSMLNVHDDAIVNALRIAQGRI